MSDETGQQTSLDEIVKDHTEEESEDKSKFRTTPTGRYVTDWEIIRGGNHFSLRNGDFLASEKRDEDETVPVYGGNGIMGYTADSNTDPGTVVIGRVGAYCGNVHLTESEAWVTDNSILLNQVSEFNEIYLSYLLSNLKLGQFSEQSAQPRISQSTVENLRIPHPPLQEQRKIASVLYNVDEAIQKTEEIISQINLVQEGITSQLFTSGPRNSETTNQRLGPVATELPAHWETETISELYTDRQLGTDERGTSDDTTQIDLIKMGNLGFGTWDLSEVEKIDRDPELLKEVGLEQGDLLFNTRNTPELVGKTAVWQFDREAIYDNNLLRLRFGDRISSGHYVNYYLSSKLGRRQLRSRVHGTTSVAAIYWSDLKQVTIPVPPIEEQAEIVEKLRTHDEMRQRYEIYQNKLQDLKQGLMQDLLSGEVRTADKNITVLPEVKKYG